MDLDADPSTADALAQQAILVVDGAHRVRSLSAGGERLLGVHAADVIGRPLGDCAIDWEAGRVEAAMTDALTDNRCRRAVPRVRLGSESIDVIAAPFATRSRCALIARVPAGARGSPPVPDCVEASGEAVALFGPDGAVYAWSRRAERLLGWTSRQAIGQCAISLLRPIVERVTDAVLLAGGELPSAGRIARFSCQGADGSLVQIEGSFFACSAEDAAWRGVFLRPLVDEEYYPEGLLARYRELVECSQDLIWSVDLEGRWTFVNAASEHIYGLRRDQLLGHHFVERVAPECRERDAEVHQELIRGHQVERHETKHLRHDGSLVDLSFSAMPLRDRSGRIIGTIGTAMDVTELNRSVNRLYDSEWRLRRVIDVCPDAIFVLQKSRISFVNPAAAILLGRGDLIGLDFVQLLARSQAQAWSSSVASLDDQGTRFPAVEVRMLRDDHEIDVELTGGAFTFTDEKAILLIARDISVRKATERALASQRLFNESIITAAPLLICGITEDGTAVFVNPAGCRTTGYPESEIIGADWWSLVLPPGHDRPLTHLLAAVRSGPVSNRQLPLKTKDGRLRLISWNCVMGREPARNTTLLICLGVDITDQRAMEAQLLQGQKLESIGQLAAGIAHEINTPTQFVGDNLRFLKEALGELDPALAAWAAGGGSANADDIEYLRQELPKAIDQSIEGIQRVASIVTAMKDYSHPDGNDMTSVDLNRAISTTLTVARNEYKYVADVETSLDDSLPPVCCLIGEINQAVLNIVVNAAHAIADVTEQRGRGKIGISTRRDGDAVVIAISDTGGGIPPQVAGRIFEPFFTTKPVGKGTGQGLFIAHTAIVKKHGGSLTFESEAGKGTTFFLRFPIAPASAARGTV